jgi:hypothetical protein
VLASEQVKKKMSSRVEVEEEEKEFQLHDGRKAEARRGEYYELEFEDPEEEEKMRHMEPNLA